MGEAFVDSDDSYDEEWSQNYHHSNYFSSNASDDWSPSHSPSRKRPMVLVFKYFETKYFCCIIIVLLLHSKSPFKNTPILKKSPRKISPSILPERAVVPKSVVTVQLDHSVDDAEETCEPTSSKPGEKKDIMLHYFCGSLVIDSQAEDEHYEGSLS